MCFGRSRTKTVKSTSPSWAGFEAFYWVAEQEGAHEKGGVEHGGGTIPMVRRDGRVVVGQCHYSLKARDTQLGKAVAEHLTHKGIIIETDTGSNRLAAAGNQHRIVGRA